MKKVRTEHSKLKRNSIDANKVITPVLRNSIIIGVLVIFTFIVFYKAIFYKLVLWDDNSYIIDNPLIRDLSFNGLKKIFSTPVIGMYNPLVFLFYAIIYKFWGMEPSAYHLFNILLHLIAVIAVYHFIYRLTKRYETAVIVALLFAIHPMHVEAVVWASETKTALYLIFYFLALTNYLKYYQENYKTKYLIFSFILFLFSVLSKPTAVTLAPMLFLLDYYLSRKINIKMFLEKIPFFLVSISFGILTLYTHIEANDSIFEVNSNYSILNNILISNYSIAFYFNKLFFPLNLCTIYPYPENLSILPLKYYLSVLIIPFIIFLIYKSGKFKKEMIFGILFFVIAISVLVRIVPSGFFKAANRYTYLSYIGFFFIIGQYITFVIDKKFAYSNKIKNVLFALFCFLVIFFTYQTTVRISIWKDSVTLFSDIIKKKPKLALAYNNRGNAYMDAGNYSAALNDYNKAIEINACYPDAYYNRGILHANSQNYSNAIKDFSKAIELNKKYCYAYINRGNAKLMILDYHGAITDYNTAIELNPGYADSYANRGFAKNSLGDKNGACLDWEKAYNLGLENMKEIMIKNCNP